MWELRWRLNEEVQHEQLGRESKYVSRCQVTGRRRRRGRERSWSGEGEGVCLKGRSKWETQLPHACLVGSGESVKGEGEGKCECVKHCSL